MRSTAYIIMVLLLVGSGASLAQNTVRKQNKPVPLTEQAKKKQATLEHFGRCDARARANNKPDTEGFKMALDACLQGK